MENNTPELLHIDWGQQWKIRQELRGRADDADYWDERAKTFRTKDHPNEYVSRFLALAKIDPGESIFDMGCGTGALSIPLGQEGHPVIAADFSTGMLAVLHSELEKYHIESVDTKVMSWTDNWEENGVYENQVDVALASRSIASDDLEDSLMRLDRVAKRRVCITLPTGYSPRLDEQVLRAVGLHNDWGHDYVFAFNILADNGIKPEVSYIRSFRKATFDDYDDAFEYYSRMIERSGIKASEHEREQAYKRLATWIKEHLVENNEEHVLDKKGLPEKKYYIDQLQDITWAFISWDTQRK